MELNLMHIATFNVNSSQISSGFVQSELVRPNKPDQALAIFSRLNSAPYLFTISKSRKMLHQLMVQAILFDKEQINDTTFRTKYVFLVNDHYVVIRRNDRNNSIEISMDSNKPTRITMTECKYGLSLFIITESFIFSNGQRKEMVNVRFDALSTMKKLQIPSMFCRNIETLQP